MRSRRLWVTVAACLLAAGSVDAALIIGDNYTVTGTSAAVTAS